MNRRKRPPLRRCPSCGGDFYAWSAGGICTRCRRGTQADATALADLARERRLERWAAAGIAPDPLEPEEARLIDEIPY